MKRLQEQLRRDEERVYESGAAWGKRVTQRLRGRQLTREEREFVAWNEKLQALEQQLQNVRSPVSCFLAACATV